MPQHLIDKLERFTRLSDEDRQVLKALARKVRLIEAGVDIIQEGDRPETVNLFLDGWACRYKQLEDGRRQIVAFFVPGDLCDIHIYVLREMDHAIAAITPVRLATVPREILLDTMDRHPRITRALWWESLVNAAIQREWTVNIGRRTALERLAHLFCELFLRLRAVGLAEGSTCPFPLTQLELADATGLTNVHVNRTLKEMRNAGLILLKSRQLTVPDLAALQKAALFNPNYLHLEREGAHLSANA
ncbi:Nitrogen fixation regulation protein FixK [Methylobacterium hispanicum]|jgi:CRP-like cAMP-binding protein|uniref:Nitrogen fixation regulation protein FixK n=1 Tax=Methylobacterium hispanicum TaxID=270350 RepID=A0AAV4ZSU2_9HYPH|nr:MULTISPECIES: Crp/Fnr family transcriptional regulator [Methylobacterium]GJD91141.1 Nitrogen fixation regulation protein FixK [Methylobacterium hispanicum]